MIGVEVDKEMALAKDRLGPMTMLESLRNHPRCQLLSTYAESLEKRLRRYGS
jgi:hypothetical protein